MKVVRSPKSPISAGISEKKQKTWDECDEISKSLLADFFDDSLDDWNIPITNTDVKVWQRYIVESLEREDHTHDLVLRIRTDGDDTSVEQQKCYLKSPWNNTNVKVGDLLSIKAMWDSKLNAYKVDGNDGFCVIHPDTLISGTTVVSSLFCRRKAVLADKYRGTDTGNSMMIVGTIVHEILQAVLIKGLKTLKEIEAVAKDILNSRDVAITLCSSSISYEDICFEVHSYLSNIQSFVCKYVNDQDNIKVGAEYFQGRITQIQDIEENVWIPQLGLKGKIDVSVRIQRSQKISTKIVEDLPLELKTGRSTFSMEHKGQLILYEMMLSEIGKETTSGLLLYLRDGIMSEIKGARNEQRDLIMLRNELSNYLCDPLTKLISSTSREPVTPFTLPEPISHHSACKSCSYSRICSVFAQFDESITCNDEHPFRKHMKNATAHLCYDDFKYFVHWSGILALEDLESRKSNFLKSLWTESSERRQQNGLALVGLILQEVKPLEMSKYLHTFGSDSSTNFDDSEFAVGEYVIVSTQKRLAIATGFIYNISKTAVTITLERNLRERYADQLFIMDKNASQSGNVFNFTSLGMLLNETERCHVLRDIIIRRKSSAFMKVLPKCIATQGVEILKSLNSGQRAAVLKALTVENFLLIKGLPGTGKTQTLVAIVRLLHLIGKSVLITSHTHSAVDNVLLRLKGFNIPILRLGADARINSQLLEYSESAATKNCHTQKDFTDIYTAFNVVGVTCLGSDHCIFMHRKFDVCIVDEATQVMQPTILRPLYFCEKFILVGDPQQLPPLVRSSEGRKRGADESLFQRLDNENNTVVLSQQYRMNRSITKLANNFMYDGALQCGSKTVETATIKLEKCIFTTKKVKWLQRVLQPDLYNAVILLDTLNCEERSLAFLNSMINSEFTTTTQYSESMPKKTMTKRLLRYANYCEAAIVLHIIEALHLSGYNLNNVGIIAPYRAQVELLRKVFTCYPNSMQLFNAVSNVEVNTVDQFQGRDKDIIIYSCTKASLSEDVNYRRSLEQEILQDRRRLNVAITRAKLKLILIGNVECLRNYSPFLTLFEHISDYSKIQLQDGQNDFNWKELMVKLQSILNT